MKTTRFLITLVAFGALTLGPGFAGQPSHPALEGRSSETRSKTTHVGPYSPASANRGGTTGAKTITKAHHGPKLPQPVHRNPTRGGDGFIPASSTSGNAAQLHQPGNAAFNRQPGARPGSVVNETPHQRPPNPNLNPNPNPNPNPNLPASVANEMQSERRLPALGLSGTPPPDHLAPRRGPAPASIGGPAILSARNTAVLSGTRMKRKP
ncbi:MAG TPA: hypothetical protein VN829_06960 [Dongiaceae bacterium]|nr:hypothetical protein [Dongiaceae bacterium]